MKKIEVSIICLAYNHEKYLRSALQGFVEQITDFGFEVLVHDDASTDTTADIIREYAEKYPDIIKPTFQTENQLSKRVKILYAFLLPKAQGKYLAFCEGDDFWTDPHKLQKQYDILEEHAECSLCVHRVVCLNKDGTANERTLPDSKYHLNSDQLITRTDLCRLYWMMGGYPFHTSSYFMRKDCLYLDIDVWREVGHLKKCLIEGDAYYIDTPMSARRLLTEGSFNQRLTAGGFKARLKMMEDDILTDYNLSQNTDGMIRDYARYGVMDRILLISNYTPQHAKELLINYPVPIFQAVKAANAKTKLKFIVKYVLLKICPEKVFLKLVKKPHDA